MLKIITAFLMQNDFSYIKLKELYKLCKGDNERELKYLKQFINLIPLNLKKLKLAIEKGDRTMIMRELHYMSPHLVFFGIDDFSFIMEREHINNGLAFDVLKDQIGNGIIKIEKALTEVRDFVDNLSENYKI